MIFDKKAQKGNQIEKTIKTFFKKFLRNYEIFFSISRIISKVSVFRRCGDSRFAGR